MWPTTLGSLHTYLIASLCYALTKGGSITEIVDATIEQKSQNATFLCLPTKSVITSISIGKFWALKKKICSYLENSYLVSSCICSSLSGRSHEHRNQTCMREVLWLVMSEARRSWADWFGRRWHRNLVLILKHRKNINKHSSVFYHSVSCNLRF